MREIKFRFWDKELKEWQRVISYKTLFEIGDEGWTLNNSKGCVISQFTGLHDKNGKEIYESDMLERGGKKYEVVFWQGSFTLRENGKLVDLRAFVNSNDETPLAEVIGNIYENPELIK